MLRGHRNETGEIIIEATIIIPLCLALLFAMICIGQVLYRQMIITVAANETAYNIAMVYPDLGQDPMTGYTTTNEAALMKPYRYVFRAGEYEGTNKAKAEWYATSIVEGSALLGSDAYPEVSVTVDEGSLFNLRRRIVVTVTDDYELPAAGFLQIFGLDTHMTITESASSDCVDMIDYMNTVGYLTELGGILEKGTALEKVVNTVQKWAKIINGG